jgi:hypothetical protein
MDDGPYQPADHEFSAALNQLDAAKALMRNGQNELNKAARALTDSGGSRGCMRAFESRNREMNYTTKCYLHAVQVFNGVCHQSRQTMATIHRTEPELPVGGLLPTGT